MISSCVFLHDFCYSPKGSVTGCDLAWRRVDDFSFFDCFSKFYFLLFEFHYAFSISDIVQTCYVYYYCIWLLNTICSCFFSRLLFSPRISHGLWLLAWEFLLFSSVLHFALMHLPATTLWPMEHAVMLDCMGLHCRSQYKSLKTTVSVTGRSLHSPVVCVVVEWTLGHRMDN